MPNYQDYLPELRTTTLFCDMTDDEILLVLNAMQPPIKQGKSRPGKGPKPSFDAFRMIIRGVPLDQLAPRYFKYDMPKFGEPGMLMMEIPVLAKIKDYVKPQGGPPPQHGPKLHDGDFEIETLEMTPDMVTRFYSAEVAPAQGKMLRNYLGILSQKVCDVRQELGIIKEGRDSYGGLTMDADKVLHIMTAGVAVNVAKKTARLWNALHPELPAVCTMGGSVDLIERVKAGEPCDVLIMADDTIIDSLLMPQYASGYRVFAGNSMVVIGSESYPISRDDWQDKLLASDATFSHFKPYGDPAGYRAVMAMLLADNVKAGLADQLMNHPGHQGMDPNEKPGDTPARYRFGYRSMAVSQHLPYAELPAVMNLSDDALAEIYAQASFQINDTTAVHGAPISHAFTIPNTTKQPNAAKAFCRLFVENDVEAAGFSVRSRVAGDDPLV